MKTSVPMPQIRNDSELVKSAGPATVADSLKKAGPALDSFSSFW